MNIGARSQSRQDGVTVIELIVGLVVIGVLIAVAVPTGLGVRDRARDSAAKSAAARGLQAQRTLFADSQRYGDSAAAEAAEPGLDFDELPADPDTRVLGKVYVRLDNASTVTLVSRSKTGRCFWTRDAAGATTYAVKDCSSEPALSDFGNSW